MPKPNVLEQVYNLMATDDADMVDQSNRIENAYAAADEKGKALIDEVFACLCGYSLKTILAGDAL